MIIYELVSFAYHPKHKKLIVIQTYSVLIEFKCEKLTLIMSSMHSSITLSERISKSFK